MMNCNRIATACLIAAISAVTNGTAQAGTTLTYTLDTVNIVANTNPIGLEIVTDVIPNSGDVVAELNDGESETFGLFRIWSNETSINPDDLNGKTINVTLNFSTPPAGGSSGTVNGTTVGTGFNIPFLGTFGTGGQVTFGGPPTIVSVAGETYSIALSNTIFNRVAGVYVRGELFAGTVNATINQISSTPEPSTMVSAAMGLVVAGGWYVRRKRTIAA